MPSIPPGTHLGRDDIIGRRLVDIVQSSSIDDDGMDWVYTVFRLDSGATFFLPRDDVGRFLAEEPPLDSTSLDHPDVRPVLGQRIRSVLRQGPDADFYHDSPYLVMENGYVVTDVMGDYHGMGYAGLHVYAPTDIDTSTMIDYVRADPNGPQRSPAASKLAG
jgi:hypothetical protein